jgi:hypothetical protein
MSALGAEVVGGWMCRDTRSETDSMLLDKHTSILYRMGIKWPRWARDQCAA